jgi:hypothetical protein
MILNEAKLLSLFDFQRFIDNKRLSELIAQTESRIDSKTFHALSDDDIDVWAAGDIDSARSGFPEFFSESEDDEN